MKLFASSEAVRESRNRARNRMRILFSAAAAMLALFIVLCLITRTGNARFMLMTAMISMVVLGWGLLAFWLFAAEPSLAEARHLEGLTEGEPRILEGRISLDPQSFRIPKSVRVLKARLETDGGTLSLNLNEKYQALIPPEGSLVRIQTVRKFITGIETIETAEAPLSGKQPAAWEKIRRGFGKFFPGAVIWTMLAVILTGFVFTRITDTDPAYKITIYADCEVQNAAELAGKLEEEMDGAVRMVKIHPFSFALFGTEQLKSADLYIVPDTRKAEYAEWLGEEGPVMADPDSGIMILGDYFRYNEKEAEPSVFRMYTGGKSVHADDGLADKAAEVLLRTGEVENR